jgi:hypothetical protein
VTTELTGAVEQRQPWTLEEARYVLRHDAVHVEEEFDSMNVQESTSHCWKGM